MTNELITQKVRASIVQDPEIKQYIQGRGKNVIVNIMINGDSAIDKACSDNGDIISAMQYILSRLPEPRMHHLRALAMVAAKRTMGAVAGASRYLSITPRVFFDNYESSRPFLDIMKKIENGEIVIKEEEP